MAIPPRPMGSLVDAGLTPEPQGMTMDLPQPEDFAGGAEVLQGADGSAIIQALAESGMDQQLGESLIEHDANLAEYLDEGYLSELSTQLRSAFDDDLQSRQEWEESYTKGLDQLGIKYEERTEPFQKASGVTHPLIAESVVQFQAQAYKELLPAGGPVKTRVLGLADAQREEQATRVKDFMNYQITEVMEDYDPDMDQLLFICRCPVRRSRRSTTTRLGNRLCRCLSPRRISLSRIRRRICRRHRAPRMCFGWTTTPFARCRLRGCTATSN